MTVAEIIALLKREADPQKVVTKATKFGITSNNALGVYHKELKEIAKQIPKDDTLAVQLFDSTIYEARLLCSKIFNPKNLTEELTEQWVRTFENWEICDSFCIGLFARSPYAVPKALEWSRREMEFEKRAGFAIMAAYCTADKRSPNAVFQQFFPQIEQASTDDRLYVKKAVNWALRSIGKRNIDLRKEAIVLARSIETLPAPSAKWIARNALKELESKQVRISDYPREIYRR